MTIHLDFFLLTITVLCCCSSKPKNPVSPRLHHEPRSISTVLPALANLKKGTFSDALVGENPGICVDAFLEKGNC